jgi:2,5-diamino-6-(ribosylamino)-4(3H)-pyrimidinone 5'-phosphate reductase
MPARCSFRTRTCPPACCGRTSCPTAARGGSPWWTPAARIPYLLAGARRADLTSALEKLRTQFGVTCLVSQAGGGLNGALLRAGLVDELHIITVPALIGGLGTPSVIDGPPLGSGSFPVPLRAGEIQVGAHGTIWAHYEVAAR